MNRAAGWLEVTFGRSSTFETMAYIGPNDIRYFIFVLAASYVGYKVRTQLYTIIVQFTEYSVYKYYFLLLETAMKLKYLSSKQLNVPNSLSPRVPQCVQIY